MDDPLAVAVAVSVALLALCGGFTLGGIGNDAKVNATASDCTELCAAQWLGRASLGRDENNAPACLCGGVQPEVTR
jgi:hypothetical protein